MEIVGQHIKQINEGVLPKLDQELMTNLVKDYPCFQSAYILKALQLKQHGDEEQLEAFLPHAAIHVQNRAKLYDLLHNNYQVSVENERVDKEDEELVALIDEAQKQVTQKEKRKEKKPKKDHKPTPDPKSTQQPSTLISNEEADDLNALINEVKAKKEKQPIVSKVEKNEKQKTVPKPKPKKKATPIKKAKAPLPEPTSFVEWLKTTKHDSVKSTSKKKSVSKFKEVNEDNVERIPIDPAASHEALLYQETKKSSFKLEDFLIGQIEKKQDKRSQKTASNIFGISETYAKILVQQGNFEKAIEVYKELSIKYPKKSANFASQIEKLKNNL